MTDMVVIVTFMAFLLACGLVMMFFGPAGIFGGVVIWIIGFYLFGWRFLWGAAVAAALGLAGLGLFVFYITTPR
jgi:hypothetical protein